MAWYADLSACDYFGSEHALYLRAVGWLEREHPFPCGDPVDQPVVDRRVTLSRNPWSPMATAGFHGCSLCRYSPEALLSPER